MAGYQPSSESSTNQYDYYSKQVLDYVKNRPDLFPDYQMTSNESLFESAKKKAIEAKDISEDVAAKQNFAGFLGEMSAGAVSVLTDPVQLGAIGVDLLYTRGATWTAMKEIFF